MVVKPKVLFIDGEGPLVFKDLARDVAARMRLEQGDQIVDGRFLFDTLSLYNAYLAESGNYPNQPGDTLALLVPHLLAHGITDEDLHEEAKNVQLANGVERYLQSLYQEGWQIRVISTAYSALWQYVGPRLGMPQRHIYSSDLNLRQLREFNFWSEDLAPFVTEAEQLIVTNKEGISQAQQEFRNGATLEEVFSEPAMNEISQALDHLYYRELARRGFHPLKMLTVIGGRQKVEVLKRFRWDLKVEFSDVAYVGDSITDDAVHRFLKEQEGLSIAVNSDYYGIRNAVVAVATEDMMELKPILDAWVEGGLKQVRALVESTQQTSIGKERVLTAEMESTRYDFVALATEEEIRRIAQSHQETMNRIRKTPVALL